MKEITLEARSRTGSGKGVARKLRALKRIPGVVYGRDETPLAIELSYDNFHVAMKGTSGENLLVNLNIDGAEAAKKAIIKDIQRDPIDGHLLHIDFMRISMTEKIKVTIPIVLVGMAEGVKNFGGIVSWVIRHVEVFCLPTDIPEKITFDITPLKIHDSIHVSDISIANVEILENPDQTVVSVIPPTVVKEEEAAVVEGEEAAAVPVEEGAAEPEVISEKKAQERQAEKSKAEKPKGEKGKGAEK